MQIFHPTHARTQPVKYSHKVITLCPPVSAAVAPFPHPIVLDSSAGTTDHHTSNDRGDVACQHVARDITHRSVYTTAHSMGPCGVSAYTMTHTMASCSASAYSRAYTTAPSLFASAFSWVSSHESSLLLDQSSTQQAVCCKYGYREVRACA